jgi:ABC-type amino acid transport substrate-binding protein
MIGAQTVRVSLLSCFLTVSAGLPAADLPAIKATRTLRVVVAADEAPETFAIAGGEAPGFEREMLEGFARLRGLRLDVMTARNHSDRILILIRNGADVSPAMLDTPDRRRLVAFTVEVMPARNVAVTLAPSAQVQTLEELRQARVAAIRGAKAADAVADAGVPPGSVVLFDRRDDLLQALETGEVSAAVLQSSELAPASKRMAGLQAGVTVGAPGVVAWAVRKEDHALRSALDDYISTLRRGPSWSRLVVKYFGDQALPVRGRRQ